LRGFRVIDLQGRTARLQNGAELISQGRIETDIQY